MLEKCSYCGKEVRDLEKHLEKCYRKLNRDKLKEFNAEIVKLVKEGHSLNFIEKNSKDLIGIELKRGLIQTICRENNVEIPSIGFKYTETMKNDKRKSLMEKFGVEYINQLDEIKEKKKQTCLKKYGVDNVSKIQMIVDKIKNTKLEKYGTLNLNKNNSGKMSFPHKKVSDFLLSQNIIHENEKTKLKYKSNDYFPIPDIFIENGNIVIEINGNFWHANPKIYSEDDEFPCYGGTKTAKEIWIHDKFKNRTYSENGYNLIVIWENEIKDESYKNNILEKINEIQKNQESTRD
jgi:G:T-mismatch repair DNA endonuclease (very short patch repair protein)